MTAPAAPKRKSRKKAEEKKPVLKETAVSRSAEPDPVSEEPEMEMAAEPLMVEPFEPEVTTAWPPALVAEATETAGAEPVAETATGLEAETDVPADPGPEELEIGEVKISLNIHPDLLAEAKTGTEEFRVKLAGVLAAQALKKYPELTASPAVDPVNIWSEIRGHVLKKFDHPRQQIAA